LGGFEAPHLAPAADTKALTIPSSLDVIGSDETIERLGPFDAAIGRYVLVHRPDSGATVRRVAGAVRPGGVVAFLEPALHIDPQLSPSDFIRLASVSLLRFYRMVLINHDIAGRITACFEDAGLPEPQVLWGSIMTGSDPLFLERFVSSWAQTLPHLERMGLVPPELGDLSTLCDRILAAATAISGQFVSVPEVSAWSIRS
jgi:hypothetical protein